MNQKIKIFADTEAQAQYGAGLFKKICLETVEASGRFRVALAGGNSYRKLHAMLAELEDIPWDKIHVYWGDERSVPRSHSDSNVGMAFDTFLDKVPVPDDYIHVMSGDLPPLEAADAYDLLLRDHFGETGGLDLLFLGLGGDGHTASLFPNTDILKEDKRLAQSVFVPEKDTYRISMTAPFLNRSSNVVFLTYGEGKADAIFEVIRGGNLDRQFPAKMIRPQGDLWWLLDETAAERLES